MSQMLPPGGPHDRTYSDSSSTRATVRQRIVAVVILAALAAVVIVVWQAPESFFGRTVIAIILTPFSFVAGIGMGVYTGWGRAGWLFPDLVFRLGLATATGIASGLVVAWLQRGFEERSASRLEKSLISALFSREIWVAQLPTTLMLFLVVGLGSYAASSAIEAMVAAAAVQGPRSLGVVVLGGSGGFDPILGLPDLIMGLVLFLGSGLAFGAVVGFFAGAPAGALYGLLAHLFQWPELIQGAAEGATASAARRSMYGVDQPHYLHRMFMSAMIGGIEGALGGAVATLLLGGLRAFGLV